MKKNKRFLALACIATLALGLTACGSEKDDNLIYVDDLPPEYFVSDSSSSTGSPIQIEGTMSNDTYKYKFELPDGWNDVTLEAVLRLGMFSAEYEGRVRFFTPSDENDTTGNTIDLVVMDADPEFDSYTLESVKEVYSSREEVEVLSFEREILKGLPVIKMSFKNSAYVSSDGETQTVDQTQYLINSDEYCYVFTFTDVTGVMQEVMDELIPTIVIG